MEFSNVVQYRMYFIKTQWHQNFISIYGIVETPTCSKKTASVYGVCVCVCVCVKNMLLHVTIKTISVNLSVTYIS